MELLSFLEQEGCRERSQWLSFRVLLGWWFLGGTRDEGHGHGQVQLQKWRLERTSSLGNVTQHSWHTKETHLLRSLGSFSPPRL